MTFAAEPVRFDRLFRTAEQQSGFFTAAQALEAGFSRQLLQHHLRAARIERWQRGVYRLVHYPQQSAHEDLVTHWLWSERAGVFGHETALSLHELSDALPARVWMTLPIEWKTSRFRAPRVLRLQFSTWRADEQQMIDGVPVTSAARTVNDCASVSFAPELLQQAVQEGLRRALFDAHEIAPALDYLRPYSS